MNGPHDMGGLQCFGPVLIEENEPVFHEPWEKLVFAATMSSFGVLGSIDAFRHAIERMVPEEYLQTTYYEHWLTALETRVDETDLRSQTPTTDPLRAEDIEVIVPTGANYFRGDIVFEQRFQVGDRIRARNMNPTGHTRLPRYVRGRVGEIVSYYGNYVFPDTTAHDLGECPQSLYSVRFEAAELWGEKAVSRDAIYIDLWDNYLEKLA